MTRLLFALAVIVGLLIAVLNTAVVLHGWLFIALVLPWGMIAVRLFAWGRT